MHRQTSAVHISSTAPMQLRRNTLCTATPLPPPPPPHTLGTHVRVCVGCMAHTYVRTSLGGGGITGTAGRKEAYLEVFFVISGAWAPFTRSTSLPPYVGDSRWWYSGRNNTYIDGSKGAIYFVRQSVVPYHACDIIQHTLISCTYLCTAQDIVLHSCNAQSICTCVQPCIHTDRLADRHIDRLTVTDTHNYVLIHVHTYITDIP